jgi:tetratricopeptide (TPR) repeat protein
MRVLWLLAAAGAVFAIATVTCRMTTAEMPLFPREGEQSPLTAEQIDRRIAEIEPQVNVAPQEAALRVDLGILYYLKGPVYYDRAIAMLDGAWRLGATDARVFYYLGVMYDFVKLPVFAAAEYRRFLANRPGDHEVMVRLAKVYYQLERYDDAAALYYEVLDQDRDNRIALGNLGLVNLARGRDAEAQEQFTRAIAVSSKSGMPAPPGVYYGLGCISVRSGQMQTAREYLRREMATYLSNTVLPTMELAKIAWHEGDVAETVRLCRIVLETEPSHRGARELLKQAERRGG